MAIKQYAALTSGTISIPVDYTTSYPDFPRQDNLITGTVTLVGNLVVSPSGTPTSGQRVNVIWDAAVTPSGSTVTVFGKTINDEALTGSFVVECIYNGSSWSVDVLSDSSSIGTIAGKQLADQSITYAKFQDVAANSIPVRDAGTNGVLSAKALTSAQILIGNGAGFNAAALSGDVTMTPAGVVSLGSSVVDTAELVDEAVTTAKIEDAAVTPGKLSASSRKEMVAIPVSFATAGEIGVLKYTMCYDCTVDAIHATVTKPATSDTATIVFKDHGGTVLTGSQVDITTSLVLGNIVSTTPSANNTFSAGEQITFETSKSTAGSGDCTVILCLTRD
jgi:hypothetical protein